MCYNLLVFHIEFPVHMHTHKMVWWKESTAILSRPDLHSSHSSIPYSYWSDAFVTAVFLINRLSTPVLSNKSHFEVLFHQKSDYMFLKTFGCQCWPNLRPYNKHKINFRSLPCIFLGYSSSHHGYLCFHVPTARMYVSRDVFFDENTFPFSVSSTNPPTQNKSTPSHIVLPNSFPSSHGSSQHNSISLPIANSTPQTINSSTHSPSPIHSSPPTRITLTLSNNPQTINSSSHSPGPINSSPPTYITPTSSNNPKSINSINLFGTSETRTSSTLQTSPSSALETSPSSEALLFESSQPSASPRAQTHLSSPAVSLPIEQPLPNTHPMQTRAKSNTTCPKIRTDGTISWPLPRAHVTIIPNEPKSVTETSKFSEWRHAM